MREIKFRARHNVTGEWFYGSSLWRSFDDTKTNYELPLSTFWQGVEKGWFDRETVGQYTGLKDKNGKEIYERDIVQFDKTNPNVKPKPTVEVIYEQGSFFVGHFTVILLSTVTHVVEVTGNIYENPELLKGDQ